MGNPTETGRAGQLLDEHGCVIETALTCYVSDMRERAESLRKHYSAVISDPELRRLQDSSLVSTEGLRLSAEALDQSAERAQRALDALSAWADEENE